MALSRPVRAKSGQSPPPLALNAFNANSNKKYDEDAASWPMAKR